MPAQVSVIGNSDLSDLYSNWVFQSGCGGFDVRLSIKTNQMLPSSTYTSKIAITGVSENLFASKEVDLAVSCLAQRNPTWSTWVGWAIHRDKYYLWLWCSFKIRQCEFKSCCCYILYLCKHRTRLIVIKMPATTISSAMDLQNPG